MQLTLDIHHPDGKTDHLSIAESGTVWIGRSDDCQVVLDSLSVSRRHASIKTVIGGELNKE